MNGYVFSGLYLMIGVLSWIELRAKGAPRRAVWIAMLILVAAWVWTIDAALTLRPPGVLEAVEALFQRVPGVSRLLSR